MAEDTVSEEWRTVAAFPDYEVSNLGRVRRRVAAAINPTRFPVGLVLTPIIDDHGYHNFCLKKRHYKANRLVCEAFNGPCPPGKTEAAHNDGNPGNNVPGNLRWATHAENMADTLRHGTHNRGERHGLAQLTETQVRQIRGFLAKGFVPKDIYDLFGISRQCVNDIRDGRRWAWLKD